MPTVPPGLRFLDTPGIGSLSASAPAQAFAWLPRCDLGLVLIAAGTAIGTDDLALVSGFVHAGITCQVLLSKSDLLRPDEVTQTVAYVERELDAVLGGARDVTVRPVSTAQGATAESSLIAFRTAVLEPLAASHAQSLHDALRARLHRLVAMTRSALAERNEAGAGARPPASGTPIDAAANAALRRQMQRDAAHAAIRATTDALADSGARVMELAASAVASAWIERRGANAAAASARAAIIREAGAALTAVSRAVDGVRGPVEGVASRPAGTDNPGPEAAESVASSADRRLPPMFDAAFLDQLPDLAPPGALRGPKRSVAERRLAPIRASLDNDLAQYGARLYAWGEQALKETLEREAEMSVALRNEMTDAGPGADALDRIDSVIDESS